MLSWVEHEKTFYNIGVRYKENGYTVLGQPCQKGFAAYLKMGLLLKK